MATQEKTHNKYLKAYGPETWLAYARWTPSSSATQTLTEAFGVRSITRSAAGTYTINLSAKCRAVSPIVFPIQNDGLNKCNVTVESSSASSRTVSIKQWTGSQPVPVTVSLADVSAASSAYVVSPVAGTVTKIYSALQGAITGDDSALTTAISTGGGAFNAITSGGWTVAYSGSAAGDQDVATPSAANSVAIGDVLRVTTDGASSTTAGLNVTFEVSPTLSDTAADEIVFVALKRMG